MQLRCDINCLLIVKSPAKAVSSTILLQDNKLRTCTKIVQGNRSRELVSSEPPEPRIYSSPRSHDLRFFFSQCPTKTKKPPHRNMLRIHDKSLHEEPAFQANRFQTDHISRGKDVLPIFFKTIVSLSLLYLFFFHTIKNNYERCPLCNLNVGTTTIPLPLTDLFGGGPSRFHGGSPWPENSRSLRYEMVSLIMEALSNWEVIAAGNGSIFASS